MENNSVQLKIKSPHQVVLNLLRQSLVFLLGVSWFFWIIFCSDKWCFNGDYCYITGLCGDAILPGMVTTQPFLHFLVVYFHGEKRGNLFSRWIKNRCHEFVFIIFPEDIPDQKSNSVLPDRHTELLERTKKVILNGENVPAQCRPGRPLLAKSWRRVWLVKRWQLGLGSNPCGDRKSTPFSIWKMASPTTRYKSSSAMNR